MDIALKTKSSRAVTYLQHTAESIHQRAVLRAGEEIRAGQLSWAHPRTRGSRTGRCPGRVTWSEDRVRGVGSSKARRITEQQGQAAGTEVRKAAGQVS